MDRGAWRATVHGVTKESDRIYRLNNSNSQFPFPGIQMKKNIRSHGSSSSTRPAFLPVRACTVKPGRFESALLCCCSIFHSLDFSPSMASPGGENR